MFEALKPGFRRLATRKRAVNVVGEFKAKRTAAGSRGFLATAWLSCLQCNACMKRQEWREFATHDECGKMRSSEIAVVDKVCNGSLEMTHDPRDSLSIGHG